MTVIFAILIFLAVLFVLVLVHEWGHYITAKLTGMRVDEFAIGFPPTLWSKKVGETTYALNSLPIGGYVKILGEDGEEGMPPLSEYDKTRTFGARPKWAQALVLLAGVTMNMLLAWVLLIIISISMIGGERAIAETDYAADARLVVVEVLMDSPAENTIPPGAHITSVSVGEDSSSPTVLTPTSFSEVVTRAGQQTVTVVYEYEGKSQGVTLSPELTMVDGQERSLLGVSLALVAPVEYGFFEAVSEGTLATIDLTKRVTVGIFTFFGDIFTGNADFSTVAGPVGIVGHVGDAAQQGLIQLLFFTALISINLAIINLLPIPALDGGRLVLVAVETVIRRPLSPRLANKVNLIGFLFLIGIMVAVTISDIWKFF
ncbi:MAG: M50 family metallopeptidase [Candidatus Paceibacteria bacterium]